MARRFSLLLALVLALPLAGCGSSAPQDFAPLTYTYLTPLRLNVGSIDIRNDFAPGPADVGGQSPVSPVETLKDMARQRLVAAGSAGRGVFTIKDASVTDDGSHFNGMFRVRVDLFTSDGQRSAFAEAAVARSAEAPGGDQDAQRAALYTFVRAMMNEMNVELEYQLRRSVGDWLQIGPATAPPPPPVQTEPLPPADSTANPTPGYRLVPSPPPTPGN